ncbi:DUF4384 domain-containing protein [bacterium]|nr:DUF4384 domain-containing protein [bacterium]
MNALDYKEKCPPSLLLEGYHSDALDDEFRTSISDHVAMCPHCQDKLCSIEIERKEFLKYNVLPQRNEKTQKAFLQPFWRILAFRIAPVCLLMAVALFALLHEGQKVEQYIGLKGALNFQIYVTRANQTFIGGDGDYYQGDQLQFSLYSPVETYIYVLNCDEEGQVTSYYPDPGVSQTPIRGRIQYFLPVSITLDDYRGLERIFVITSQKPWDVLLLIQELSHTIRNRALESIDDLDGIEGLQKTYLIKKTG